MLSNSERKRVICSNHMTLSRSKITSWRNRVISKVETELNVVQTWKFEFVLLWNIPYWLFISEAFICINGTYTANCMLLIIMAVLNIYLLFFQLSIYFKWLLYLRLFSHIRRQKLCQEMFQQNVCLPPHSVFIKKNVPISDVVANACLNHNRL